MLCALKIISIKKNILVEIVRTSAYIKNKTAKKKKPLQTAVY
jgi:hypothetical protein